MMEKLVVIGAGMASGRALEHLFETAPGRFAVTLFNTEPRGNYNRLMLSPVLSGDKTAEDIVTHDADWYAAHGVVCRFGERVEAIDTARKVVIGAAGEVAYDRVILATGSSPVMLPLPGAALDGVLPFRDLDDTARMVAAARPGARAVVIGGGLLGLEAAAGLKARGMEVTVVHLMGHLMERQLDVNAGYLLRGSLEDRGITVLCDAKSQAIEGVDGKVSALLLEDGRRLPCDLLVMAVGIRPTVDVARAAGLAVNRGVLVDAQMRTSDPNILALGECVEFEGQLFGLVAPLYDQAQVVAKTLMGEEARFRPRDVSTRLKVTGCDLFSAGDFASGEGREDIVLRDPARGVYRRLVLKDDRIVGVVLYGDTADGDWFLAQLKEGADISALRDRLILGPAGQGATGGDPLAAVAALPPETEICGCNGVSKARILEAIDGGATDLEAVRARTKASGSCGSCAGLVEKLIAATLGADYATPVEKPLCGCTEHTHGEVRRLIKARALKSIPAVMQELGWTTVGGCPTCRPALNYYLLADWPLEYVDDRQSRLVNERNHANIQKDGTYSVVPRMWGGVTTPEELRAIADAADKFKVAMVKVTGGQRIDLLGVRKEDLPAIWADLNAAGMVSGHAYAKGLRTVKTCVGEEFCRFGTQDSTGLGIKLEKLLWGSWTPHKVKLAVSGCPRNCAEATCKDLGVVCVDGGYQISVGGAAGMEVKETQSLCQVETEDEVLEVTGAFVQLYRENAFYLHRVHKWLAAVGLDWCRERVVDDLDSRRALFARFTLSQSVYRTDPWAAHATPEERPKWAPLVPAERGAAE
jgi:nitrite reductase (NADH) large subunit